MSETETALKDHKHNYAGYTYDDRGVRIWPLRKYCGLWKHLLSVTSSSTDTVFTFADRKPLQVRLDEARRRFPRYFECIAVAVKNARKDVILSRHTKLILEYGHRQPEIKAMKKQIKQEPDNAGLALTLSNVLRATGDTRSALKVLTTSLKYDPENLDLLRAEATALAETPARRIEAFSKFESILKQHPDDITSAEMLALMLLAQGNQHGLTLAERTLNNSPGSVDLRFAIASHLGGQKQFDKAMETLTPLLQADQPDTVTAQAAQLITELERLKCDPAAVTNEVKRARRIKLQSYIGPAIAALIFGSLMVISWILFAVEAKRGWRLHTLRTNGVCTPGIVMQRSPYSTRKDSLIQYRFSTRPADRLASPADMREWIQHAPPDFADTINPPESYADIEKTLGDMRKCESNMQEMKVGVSYMSLDLERQIRGSRQFQYVLYLANNPDVSAIGPITAKRIWLSWTNKEGNIKCVIYLALSIYLAIAIPLGIMRKRRLITKSMFLSAAKERP